MSCWNFSVLAAAAAAAEVVVLAAGAPVLVAALGDQFSSAYFLKAFASAAPESGDCAAPREGADRRHELFRGAEQRQGSSYCQTRSSRERDCFAS